MWPVISNSGEIKLFGRDYRDAGIRSRVGALIENTGGFPGSSVWDNMMMQAINLGLKNPKEEINRVLQIVRMEDSIKIKFKSCSLGMKQRIGIAMALIVIFLEDNGILVSEIKTDKISLEEYYMDLMHETEDR